MRQKELRIGNIVISVVEEGYPVEARLTIEDFGIMNDFLIAGKEIPYEPIDLTEEQLQRFDLTKFPFRITMLEGSIYIRLNKELLLVKTVHQLQNIYYGALGKELHFKQPPLRS